MHQGGREGVTQPASFFLPGRDRLRREMEQSGPFPNPASKLPNLKFYVYVMVALPPLFMGSVDAPRRTRGRPWINFSCTEETRSGVYFAERTFSKTRILVLFFLENA